MKRKLLARDWSDARAKVEGEGKCRVCGKGGQLEAAHTIGRALQDAEIEGPRGGRKHYVNPSSVIALCGGCHFKFDARGLDILPYLTVDEQINAVDAAGGIYRALGRLCPSEFGRSA